MSAQFSRGCSVVRRIAGVGVRVMMGAKQSDSGLGSKRSGYNLFVADNLYDRLVSLLWTICIIAYFCCG